MTFWTGVALLCSAQAAPAPLTAADRAEIIQSTAKVIEQRYVDPELGRKLARQLRGSDQLWSAISDPKLFAIKVTEWLRENSKDGHLGLSYSEDPLSPSQGAQSFSVAEMERYYGRSVNHGVQKIERLSGNIMLVELSVFPPSSMGGEVVAAAMNVAAQGDAMILDLRRNGGGSDTVALVAAYLLDGAKPLSGKYDRPTNSHRPRNSPDWVPGRRFGASKPLYILTSNKTFSAAEALAYDLQALKRATIVGEKTGGGAHPFEYRRVHTHFAVDLPEGKSINPITGGNWQGTGVQPDVLVPAAQALEKALELARARSR
jgi:hypothetical protein